jgi:hypothetical protein
VGDQELVRDGVELVGGDAGRDRRLDEVEGQRGQPPGGAHPPDGVRVLDLAAPVGGRGRAVDVLGAGDRSRHVAPRRDAGRGKDTHLLSLGVWARSGNVRHDES